MTGLVAEVGVSGPLARAALSVAANEGDMHAAAAVLFDEPLLVPYKALGGAGIWEQGKPFEFRFELLLLVVVVAPEASADV